MSTYARTLDALGDGTRRAIFERLRTGPRSVGELAVGLPVTRPAVSQHLRVLRDAGLVASDRRGTSRIYRIDPNGLVGLRAYIEGFWDETLGAFKDAAEQEEGEAWQQPRSRPSAKPSR